MKSLQAKTVDNKYVCMDVKRINCLWSALKAGELKTYLSGNWLHVTYVSLICFSLLPVRLQAAFVDPYEIHVSVPYFPVFWEFYNFLMGSTFKVVKCCLFRCHIWRRGILLNATCFLLQLELAPFKLWGLVLRPPWFFLYQISQDFGRTLCCFFLANRLACECSGTFLLYNLKVQKSSGCLRLIRDPIPAATCSGRIKGKHFSKRRASFEMKIQNYLRRMEDLWQRKKDVYIFTQWNYKTLVGFF